MSKLGMLLGLPLFLCLLCVGLSEGWLWWEGAKDDKQTATPANVRPETQRRKGTSADRAGQRVDAFAREEPGSVSEAFQGLGSGAGPDGSVVKENQPRDGSGVGSGSGLGSGSESGSAVESLGSGSAYGSGSVVSIGERQEVDRVTPTDFASLTEGNAYVYTEGPTVKSDLTNVDQLQRSVTETYTRVAEEHASVVTDFPRTTDDQTRENLNVSPGELSSSSTSSIFSSTPSRHASNGNTTQYSREYSVPVDLLTTGSKNALALALPPTTLPTWATPRCLPLDSDLPFCAGRKGVSGAARQFAVPNFLNHTSVEEVRAALSEWAWLLRSRCHHALEWFFCLLLVPGCDGGGGGGRGGHPPPPPQLPCRSFCEVLVDSCWTLLPEGRFAVECHLLPEEKESGGDGGDDDDGGDEGYQCLSVSNQKGNGGLECISF